MATTYRELFADPNCDPSNGTGDPTPGYSEIFARWRAVTNPPSMADLHAYILTDFDSPIGAVGFFVQDSKSPGGVLRSPDNGTISPVIQSTNQNRVPSSRPRTDVRPKGKDTRSNAEHNVERKR